MSGLRGAAELAALRWAKPFSGSPCPAVTDRHRTLQKFTKHFGLDQGRGDCELWHCDRTDGKPGQIPPTGGVGKPKFLREYCIGSV
jgi:hypothetical protein